MCIRDRAWAALLYAIRFGMLEIPPETDPCLADALGASCRWRTALGLAIHWQVFGWLALGSALGVWLLPTRLRHTGAAVVGFLAVLALVLYNVRYGAPAAVLALLAGVSSPTERAEP